MGARLASGDPMDDMNERRMTMSGTSMANDAQRPGPVETIEPGVAHVEIEPGEPTETVGRGQLQVDDETGKHAPADRPATGTEG